MQLLRRSRKPARSRVFVLGLDGTPYTWLRSETGAGRLRNLAALFADGALAPMRSSVPSVSSTAWTTFFTGQDPGGHGVFGFMDCKPDSHEFCFPNYTNVRSPAVWEELARHGKRSVVLNVPGTYPARELNGVLISGFVAPSIDRAVYPPELLPRLKAMGYRIDLDAWTARGSFEALDADLFATFAKRWETVRLLLDEQDWDLFVAVVTETDRLYHFLWNAMATGDPRAVDLFIRFHAEIDRFVGWLVEALPPGTALLSMSDHGFTVERVDVFTNAWLVERGYLGFDTDAPKGVAAITPASTVYSLDPGRFYVNRAGRRPRGSVAPDQVEAVCDRLVADLAEFRNPDTGDLVYGSLLRRNEAYHGAETPHGPDVVLTLRPGYELKGSTAQRAVFGPPAEGLGGMHSYDDAHLYVRGATLRQGPYELYDVAPTIVGLLDIEPTGFRGRPVLASLAPAEVR